MHRHEDVGLVAETETVGVGRSNGLPLEETDADVLEALRGKDEVGGHYPQLNSSPIEQEPETFVVPLIAPRNIGQNRSPVGAQNLEDMPGSLEVVTNL